MTSLPLETSLEFDRPNLRQVDLVLCALETAATCSRFSVKGVLKITFSSSQSKESRCKRLVSFLAKSALGNFINLFD